MRPTPQEVIAGVRAILKSDIATNLPAQVQPQVKRLLSVLRDGHWNDAAFELMHENAVFADLARACADQLGKDGGVGLKSLASNLIASAAFDAPGSFAEANEINRRLREALVRLIEVIRDDRLKALDPLCQTIGTALLGLRQGR